MANQTPPKNEDDLRELLQAFTSEDDRRGFDAPTMIIPAGITVTLRHVPNRAAQAASADAPSHHAGAPDFDLSSVSLDSLDFDILGSPDDAAFVAAASEPEFDVPEPSLAALEKTLRLDAANAAMSIAPAAAEAPLETTVRIDRAAAPAAPDPAAAALEATLRLDSPGTPSMATAGTTSPALDATLRFDALAGPDFDLPEDAPAPPVASSVPGAGDASAAEFELAFDAPEDASVPPKDAVASVATDLARPELDFDFDSAGAAPALRKASGESQDDTSTAHFDLSFDASEEASTSSREVAEAAEAAVGEAADAGFDLDFDLPDGMPAPPIEADAATAVDSAITGFDLDFDAPDDPSAPAPAATADGGAAATDEFAADFDLDAASTATGRSAHEEPVRATPARQETVASESAAEPAGYARDEGGDETADTTSDESLSDLVAEMLALLVAEMPSIRETLANTLIVASAPDMAPNIRVEALQRCAADIGRFAGAAEAGGFAGAHALFDHLHDNLVALARPEPPVSPPQAAMLESCAACMSAYLSAPSQPAVIADLVAAATDPAWPVRLPLDAAALAQALGAVASMVVDDGMPARAERATAADVSLTVPEDVNPELLDGLLQELPGHTEEFTLAIQRLLVGGSLEDVTAAQRVAHTVKGAGNTVGVRGIAHLTHQLEDILLALSKGKTLPPRALAESLMAAADCLEGMSESLVSDSEPPPDAMEVLQDILDWANRIDREGLPEPDAASTQTLRLAPGARMERTAARAEEAAGTHNAAAAVPMIRLPATVVDELLRLVGETIIMTGQIRDRLDRAEGQTRSMQQQFQLLAQLGAELEQFVDLTDFGARHRGLPAAASGFDSLEMDHYSELHTYGRRMVEAATDASEMGRGLLFQLDGLGDMLGDQERLNGETQEAVMRTRMVPVKSVFARLQRSVRQTCRLTGKQAELHLAGGETLIDSDVLGSTVDALMHLLRNAIDHGIESEEKRRAASKPVAGNVYLDFGREGNNILIRCRDDGAGLDYASIRAAATARGLLAEGQQAGEDELKRLVLQANFSTRSTATQTSGRGIGLDAVHSHAVAMGGSVALDSRAGRGCSIELRLPVSLISSHALLVQVGQFKIAIANRGITQILHPASGEMYRIGDKPLFRMGNDTYAVRMLDDLLGVEADRRRDARQARPLLLVQDADGVTAVGVDAVLESRDLVVKNFGRYVGKMRGLLGATILGDGGVTPVLDLPELLRTPLRAFDGSVTTLRTHTAPASRLPIAFVVDDSLSARRSLASFMTDTGYDVRTARDGVEAVELLASVKPDILLVDLEMPRMNGMELASYVRGLPEFANVPIIMVTSRSTEKHRREAEAAGVNVYMSKPFSEDALLDHLRELAGA